MSTGNGQARRRAAATTGSVVRGRAMVTGGTSGIGLAFARALAARGCDLVLVARDEARLARTAEQLRWRYGVEVETLAADLSDRAAVDTVVGRLAHETAPVEVLVNNAGHGVHHKLLDPDTFVHETALDVMVRAVLLLGSAAGRTMVGRGHGVIINVASVAGLVAMGSYSAIKAWVRIYSESLSMELRGTGVRATALMPGWVRTEFHDRAGIRASSIPDGLWLDADRVVEHCLRDVEAGKIISTPSKRYAVLSALAAHSPRPMVRTASALINRSRR